MTPLRVAIVGRGRMGRRHLEVLSELASVEVTGVLDHHATGPGRFYPDLTSLLADAPDAVVIATPPATHLAVATRALRAGLHVLVEKPMTGELGAAQQLVDLARAADRVLAVGFVERFNPALPAIPVDVDAITTRRTSTAPPPKAGGDVLLDLAVHDIDLVRYATHRHYAEGTIHVVDRDATGRVVEAVISGRLHGGATVSHLVSWTRPIRERSLGWRSPAGTGHHDLSGSNNSLVRQALAFVQTCRGDDAATLARGGDGVAALRCLLAWSAPTLTP